MDVLFTLSHSGYYEKAMRIAGKIFSPNLNIVPQIKILCEGKVSTANENNKKTLDQKTSTRVSCNIILVKKILC